MIWSAYALAAISVVMFIINCWRRRDPGFTSHAIWVCDQLYLLLVITVLLVIADKIKDLQ